MSLGRAWRRESGRRREEAQAKPSGCSKDEKSGESLLSGAKLCISANAMKVSSRIETGALLVTGNDGAEGAMWHSK